MEDVAENSAPEAEASIQETPRSRCRLPVTVEPVLLLYSLYYSGAILIAEQYVFKVESEYFNYTKKHNLSACDGHRDNASIKELQLQKKVQSASSMAVLILNSSGTVLAIFTTLLLGAYSDGGGRRIAIAAPVVGAIAKCLTFVTVIRFRLSYWYLLIGTGLEGLTGSWYAILMGSFAYVADVSEHQKRTFRVTVVEVCLGLASALGQIASGYMIEAWHFLYPFIVLVIINVLNVCYILFLLPETRTVTEKITGLCKPTLLAKPFKLYLKDDGTHRRWKLLFIISTMLVVVLASNTRSDPQTYFLRGKPLCFSPVQVGYFAGGTQMALNLGSLFGVRLLSHKIGDLGLIMVACVSGTFSMVLFAFSFTVWMVSLVPVIGVFGYMTIPCVRGYSSKLVTSHEQGALFAAIAFVEAIGNLLGVMAINATYSATISILPGFVFLLMAVFYLMGLSMAGGQIQLTRRERREYQTLED